MKVSNKKLSRLIDFSTLLAVAVTIFSLLACNSGSNNAGTNDVSPLQWDDSQFQQLLDASISYQVPGAVLLVRNGKNEFTGSSGIANLDTAEAMTKDHLFYIASITKPIVATAAMQLYENAVLDIDDPITTWLPEEITQGIPSAKIITLRMLLNQTSGIFDYYNSQEFFDIFIQNPDKHWTTADALAYSNNKPLAFPPGSNYAYSNTNYLLIGLIIDNVTGQHHATAIRNRILEPLSMASTFYLVEEPIVGVMAHGYLEADTGLEDSHPWFSHFSMGHTGIVSTVTDLATFIESLVNDNTLLSEQTKSEMFTSNDWYPHALGITLIDSPHGKAFYYSGGVLGYRSEMVYIPEQDLTVVAFGNGVMLDSNIPVDSITKLVIDAQELAMSNGIRPPISRF